MKMKNCAKINVPIIATFVATVPSILIWSRSQIDNKFLIPGDRPPLVSENNVSKIEHENN